MSHQDNEKNKRLCETIKSLPPMTRDTAERARERSCFYCANTHNFTEEKCECACHKLAPTWDALEAIGKDLGWTIPQLIAIQKLQSEAREQLAAWMTERSFSTGHGDTFEDLLKELDWQVKELREKAVEARLEGLKEAFLLRPGLLNEWNSTQFREGYYSGLEAFRQAIHAALAQALQPEEKGGGPWTRLKAFSK